MENNFSKYLVFTLLLLLSAFIPQAFANPIPADETAYTPVHDPYERYNRAVFRFNDTMDTYFLKPVANFYNHIMPKPLNRGIHNAYLNIMELPTIGNDILQLHFGQALNDFWRFTINTTLGIGGLFDIATRMHLPYYSNDFGLTLARYGYYNSNYFVIPFWGPSTLRDTMSMPVDYYAFEIYPWIYPYPVRYGVYGLGVVDKRAQLLQYQPLFEAAAIDKYAFLRNAYLQRRNFQIEQNRHLGRANMPEEELIPGGVTTTS